MKKIYAFIIILLLIPFPLISCSSENNTPAEDISNSDTSSFNEDIQEEEEEEEVPITFEALNKPYTSSKDLSLIEIGTNIYDDQQSLHYTEGEYKELDFIKDLLYLYLNEDSSIFNYLVSYDSSMEKGYTPITEKDKEKLIKDLNSLRSQMELSSGEEMVVRLDKVTYEGPSSKTNTGSTFKIRVAISRVGATVVPWNYFTITVFQDGNNLLAHLF
ncbi:MAG: hypothetical protein E7212_04900 [Clostridium sartagoforme]|nr:hypothetical protein [Clostridium sartagoforme]